MTGLLPLAGLVHDLALLTGGQHGLQGSVYTAFRYSECYDGFVPAFSQSAMIIMGLRRPRSSATFGQLAAQLLPARMQLSFNASQPIEGLLAGEQRLGVLLHCILLLTLTQRANRFQGEMKWFHAKL